MVQHSMDSPYLDIKAVEQYEQTYFVGRKQTIRPIRCDLTSVSLSNPFIQMISKPKNTLSIGIHVCLVKTRKKRKEIKFVSYSIQRLLRKIQLLCHYFHWTNFFISLQERNETQRNATWRHTERMKREPTTLLYNYNKVRILGPVSRVNNAAENRLPFKWFYTESRRKTHSDWISVLKLRMLILTKQEMCPKSAFRFVDWCNETWTRMSECGVCVCVSLLKEDTEFNLKPIQQCNPLRQG